MGIVDRVGSRKPDLTTTMSALAGNKNFVVVVPEYHMNLADVPDGMIDTRVEYLSNRLNELKTTYGFQCNFKVIKLGSNVFLNRDSLLRNSSSILTDSADENIVMWNEAIMENYIMSMKKDLGGLIEDPSYVVCVPPYWTPSDKSEDSGEYLSSLARFFMEPEHKGGKMYLFESDKRSPWFYHYDSTESGNDKVLEEEDEWNNVLHRIWTDEDWKRYFGDHIFVSSDKSLLLSTDAPLLFINSFIPYDSYIDINITPRVELLEWKTWTIKSDNWMEILKENTVLEDSDIEVIIKGDGSTRTVDERVIIWKHKNKSLSHIVSIMNLLLKSLPESWYVHSVSGMEFTVKRGDGITRFVDSEDNWYVLKNGLRVLRDSVNEVIDIMK